MSNSKKISLFSLKGKLIITLFGSYDPAGVRQLVNLRNCMIKHGYKKCKLVVDHPYPTKRLNENNDQYFLRKSIFWLEHSDACVFVFFHGCSNDGVLFELKHACDHLTGKHETCIVMIEARSKKLSTSLIRGALDNQNINQRFFKDEAQLCKFCRFSAISFLKIRKYFILERQ